MNGRDAMLNKIRRSLGVAGNDAGRRAIVIARLEGAPKGVIPARGQLPKAERGGFIREAYRVLKPGGLLIFADSLQSGDSPDLDWALERFPKAYHEPFFKSYCGDNLIRLLKQATGVQPQEDHEFLTKVVWIQKPLSSSLS